MRDIELEEDLSDPHRYNSVDNWDPYKKQRKAAAKLTRDFLTEPLSPFRQLNGDELAKTPAPIKEPKQLYGSLWREGEVALLFGETATGKSILATQIAESIARGITPRVRSPHVARAQSVLYFDFERTLAQFIERYSIRRSPTSDRRIKYKFFRNFNRLDLENFLDTADNIKGELGRFLRDAVCREIEKYAARIIIIDNISYLASGTGNSVVTRLIKTLKLWSAIYGVSILAVGHKRDRGRPRPLSLADLPPYASLADTVFAIAPSSMSPDIRYIKHLKSSRNALSSTPGLRKGGDASSAGWSGNDTLTLRLERLSEPGAIATGLLNSTPGLGGVAAASADGVVVSPSTIKNSQLSTINSQLTEAPFLGFTYLGHAAEAEHLRDYQREARDAHDREQKKLRQWHRSSKDALIQGYFDGSYARYLKGE